MPRILVVDDDPAVRSAVETVLVYEGFDVVVAGDGPTAIARPDIADFDLVIVDIFMPGLDGFETIEALHARAPTVPIIAMSGLIFQKTTVGAPPDFQEMATGLGATRSLHKPFRPSQLLAAVHDCIGEPPGPKLSA